MWLIIDVILVVALGAAILWGTHQWRQRRRGQTDRRSDEAVKRVYREEDSKR